MKTIDLNNNDYDKNNNYYKIVLDLETKEYFQIKNAGCFASLENYLAEEYKIKFSQVSNRFKIFSMGTDDFLNINKIYKKYHKYFKG